MEIIDLFLSLIVLAGIILVIPEYDFGNNIMQGVLWGTLSGFTFALLTILNRLVVQKYERSQIAFYQDIVATIVLLPAFFLIKPEITTFSLLGLLTLVFLYRYSPHFIYFEYEDIKSKDG